MALPPEIRDLKNAATFYREQGTEAISIEPHRILSMIEMIESDTSIDAQVLIDHEQSEKLIAQAKLKQANELIWKYEIERGLMNAVVSITQTIVNAGGHTDRYISDIKEALARLSQHYEENGE
jgi:hypothetical protein